MSNHKIEKLIRKDGDPVLKTVCAPVKPGDDLSFLDTLDRVCRKHKGAAGLAAPQIGVAKRAIMLYCADDKGVVAGRLLLNPEIVARSEETEVGEEGCLSYPGIVKQIRRHVWITVKYQDRTFRERTVTYKGWIARVTQHEVDHLDGLCKVGDDSYEPDIVKTTPEEQAQLLADQKAAQDTELMSVPYARGHQPYRRRHTPTATAALFAAVAMMGLGR